jgi:hypothetical protein
MKLLSLVDGKTTYRTLSPKRMPLQNRTDSPVCERCLEKEETVTHVLCECVAINYLRFRHLGHYFMEPNDYHDAPVSRILHFIQSVGLLKG